MAQNYLYIKLTILVDLRKQVQITKQLGNLENTENFGLVIGKFFGRTNTHVIGEDYLQKIFLMIFWV